MLIQETWKKSEKDKLNDILYRLRINNNNRKYKLIIKQIHDNKVNIIVGYETIRYIDDNYCGSGTVHTSEEYNFLLSKDDDNNFYIGLNFNVKLNRIRFVKVKNEDEIKAIIKLFEEDSNNNKLKMECMECEENDKHI